MKNILLIGDSISLDYGRYLEGFTGPDLHVYGKPGREAAYENLDIPVGGNGGDSRMVLEHLRETGEAVLDGESDMISLEPELIAEIEEILKSGKSVEIAVRNGKIVVWAVSNKKRYEQPIA